MKNFIISILYLLTSFQIYSSPETNISEILHQLPESDREDLDRFIKLLFVNNEMAYTLFGSKPITSYGFFKSTLSHPLIYNCLIIEKGWNAWLKNRHLFPSERFVLKKEECQGLASFVFFYLINRDAAFSKIKQHLELFKENLEKNITPEEILNRLCSDEPIRNVLFSQFISGIFFGYGENNSRAFEKESEMLCALGCMAFPPFSFDKAHALALFTKTKKELQNMQKNPRYRLPKNRILSFSSLSELDRLVNERSNFELPRGGPFLEKFNSPGFIYWDEKEAKELQVAYLQTSKVIRERYTKGGFLEVILNQWISSSKL